jgi:hypothetical protein
VNFVQEDGHLYASSQHSVDVLSRMGAMVEPDSHGARTRRGHKPRRQLKRKRPADSSDRLTVPCRSSPRVTSPPATRKQRLTAPDLLRVLAAEYALKRSIW